MAVSDDIRKQHEKVRKKGFKAGVKYFWDYYKIPTAVVLFVVILVVSLVRDMLNSKPYGFYCTMFNVQSSLESGNIGERMEEEFTEYSSLDETKYTCYIDTTAMLNVTGYDEITVATRQKIAAITATAELDSLIADPTVFEMYSMAGYFMDLADVIGQDGLEKYKDQIYYVDQAAIDKAQEDVYDVAAEESEGRYEWYDDDAAADSQDGANGDDAEPAGEDNTDGTENSDGQGPIKSMQQLMEGGQIVLTARDEFELPDPSLMEKPVPVGIVITDAQYLEETGAYSGTVPIYGVLANCSRPAMANEFLEFLYKDN